MRPLMILGIVPLMVTMACGQTKANDPQAAPAGASSSPAASASRDAQIYSAVLRRYLTTPGENANLQFSNVFVTDHADVDAADPMRTTKSDQAAPIVAADQLAIASAVRDVATIRFVPSRDAVLEERDGCPTVRDNGIAILLGPPAASGSEFHVGINGFATCLGATWHTYVVAGEADGWVVTGTVGPVTIS
jgi:hypothetical protein